jgi:type VI secretion system secreted protein VgrG
MQTAWVVGPNATDQEQTEQIYTDPYGRVKVQFHWDRQGEMDDRSSCWIRVAQIAAGSGWGAHFWPRVGHEVVVSFLEGDPDQPLIVGSVYNAVNMPPYSLPEHQSRSGIKTRSTLNGKADHFNELRFEDKKGHEQVYIHAERNMDTVVENNDTATIHGNRTETVKKLKKVKVSGGREVLIEGDLDSYPFPVADGLKVDGTRHTEIEGDDIGDVRGQRSMHSDGRHDITSFEEIRLIVGGSMLTIDAMGISLSVGANSIKIDQLGVWIDGLNVSAKGQILASMHAPVVSMTADATTTVNAPLTNILSTGPLILKGAMAGMTF